MFKYFRTQSTDGFLKNAKKVYKKHAKVAHNRKNALRGAFGHEKPATH